MSTQANAIASTSTSDNSDSDRAATLMSQFQEFRTELDAHHDRRQRIVKLSRDITALSKKLIFVLHRITNQSKDSVIKEADEKLKELKKLFAKLQNEVQGDNFWRYEKSVSPGIQEYLEGLTFYHYLVHQKIPSLDETQTSLIPAPPSTPSLLSATAAETGPASAKIAASPAPFVRITPEDYLGGIADLTGELMRLAIGSIGKTLAASISKDSDSLEKGKNLQSIEQIGFLVREIKAEMDPLAPYARWLDKKLTVLDQSLAKIELASYNLRIRGAEFGPESVLGPFSLDSEPIVA